MPEEIEPKEPRYGKSYSLPHSLHMAIGILGLKETDTPNGNASAAIERLINEALDARAMREKLTPAGTPGG